MFKIPDKPIKRLNQVKQESLKSVLFILAGLEGNCDCFQGLAEQLESYNVQVFALEYSKCVPTDRVDYISEYYIKVIEKELSSSGLDHFNLAGYSFGGLISIDICRQIESNSKLKIDNLIIIESSHTFFRYGVHSNSKQFGICIENKDIFMDQTVFPGTLSIYLSYILGINGKQFRFDLYKFLNKGVLKGLNDAIDKAFDYVKTNQLYEFESEDEINEKKDFLRLLLLKSNAGIVYSYDKRFKLKSKTSLIKTRTPLYKDFDLYFINETGHKEKLKFSIEDFDLKEIVDDLKIFILKKGNHFSFVYESLDELTSVLMSLIDNFVKSKI